MRACTLCRNPALKLRQRGAAYTHTKGIRKVAIKMVIIVSTKFLGNPKLCLAILGVGLLALTGCGGGAESSSLESADSRVVVAAKASANASPTPKPSTEPTPKPKVTVSGEWIESEIPFDSVRQDDPNAELGVEGILVAGVAGVTATHFEVTVTDGVETRRVAVSEEIRVAPVNEVIGVGSKAPVVIAPPAPAPIQPAAPAGSCDPNYEGGCVPIDSDVDCAGGSGNGPSYVQGPVYIVGTDIYGLDRNGDGVGCE